MAKLERDKYSTEHKYCEFQIINPHSFTYHSSEQAALPAEGQLGAVPSSQRMDASTSKPGAAKPASASATKVCPNCGQVNQADFRFCTKCRYTFPVTPPSQPQASSKLQATAASTSPKTPPAKMSVHYLNRGTRYHVGDNAFSNSTDKEFVGAYPVVGQAWAQPFALSHDDEVVIVIEHLWGVDYYHNNVVYIGDTEVGRIDGEHNHKQWTSPSAVALKGGKTYLVKVTSQGPGDADDFVFEGVIVQTKGDTKMQVMGKPKILQNPEDDYWSSTYDQGASAAKARQCPDCGYANQAGSNFCMRCGYNFLTSASRQTIVPPSKPVPQPTQPPVYTPPASVQQPVYTSSQPAYQQPMQFVTMPEKEKTTGCWGVGLGIATIIGGIVLIFAGLALFDNAAGLLYLADALFGIIAGIISIAKRNTAGVVMCIVAWVLVVFITLLVVAVG